MNKSDRRAKDVELAHVAVFSLMIGGGLLLLAANLLGAGDSAAMALLGGGLLVAGLAFSRRRQ